MKLVVRRKFTEVPKSVRSVFDGFIKHNFIKGPVRFQNTRDLRKWVEYDGYDVSRTFFKRLCGTLDYFLGYNYVILHIDEGFKPMDYITNNSFSPVAGDVIIPDEFEMYVDHNVPASKIKLVEYSYLAAEDVGEFVADMWKKGYMVDAKELDYDYRNYVTPVSLRCLCSYMYTYEGAGFVGDVFYKVEGKDMISAHAVPFEAFLAWLWNEYHGLPSPEYIFIDGILYIEPYNTYKSRERVRYNLDMICKIYFQGKGINELYRLALKSIDAFQERYLGEVYGFEVRKR